jgi:GNAT superfamily N-acetyltransferase
MTILIRAAHSTEIDWINQKYDEVDFVHSVFEKEIIAIAEHEGEKAGIGRLVTIDDNNLELGGMYVFEPFRKKGIAKEIVQFLLKQARPFQTVYCIPFQHLVPFYQSYSFEDYKDLNQAPHEIVAKYLWCKEKYPHPTSLLCFRREVCGQKDLNLHRVAPTRT